MFFALLTQALAQERTVTGKVTDPATGEGIPGVSVFVKGTTAGTVTDAVGNYKIAIPENGVLVFQAVGLIKQEVSVGNQSVLDVQMQPDVVGLNEVVVTGYAVQEKRSITGSIASVKGATIENIPLQTFDRAIQGRIAGVQVAAQSGQPGGNLNVRIRGIGSINAGNNPLYIIDGVQVASGGLSGQGSSNALGSINPNDIESIEVLKDAAASAIYGAQAANGVVIITTKKGKKGKARIDINVQEGIVQPLNLYEVTNAQQFAQLKFESYRNRGLPTTGTGSSTALFGDPTNLNLPSYDWVDALFRDARLSSYDVSMSGGDERTSFYLSAALTKQEGQAIKSDWQRGTLKLNVSHQASEKLTVGAKINLSAQETNGTIADGNFVNGPWTAAFVMQPFSFAKNPETGLFNPYPVSNPGSHFFGYNIEQGVEQEVRRGLAIQVISSINATYQILPYLSFNSFIGVDFTTLRDDNFRPSTIPAFAAQGGQVFVNQSRFTNFNTNHNFNFSKKIAEAHNISGVLGFEIKAEQRETGGATGRGLANQALRYLGNTAVPVSTVGAFTEYKRVGFFGQAKYDFKDKYFADFTLRRDGSSRFGADTRFGTFYAGSVGWRLSAEEFMKSLSFLSDLKIRASYGVLGNSEIADYASQSAYGPQTNGNSGSAQYLGSGGLSPVLLGNTDLTWEEEAQFNTGFDFALFNGRLYGSFDYWRTINSKLLLDAPFAADGGFVRANPGQNDGASAVVQNVGKLLNRGIDIDINSVNIDKGGFKWTTNFNISFLKNEILDLGAGRQRIGNTYIVGQPIYIIWGYEYAGVNPANGRAMIIDSAGNYKYYGGQFRDQKVLGKRVPDYFGGLTNTFSYKGLTLDVFFQYQIGNDVFLADLYNLADAGSSGNNQLVSQLSRWQKPGDITNVPMPFQGGVILGQDQLFGDAGSSRFMSDGSYIRFKQVRLSYELPSKLLSKIGFRRVNIYGQAVNLATLTKFVGIDPEVVGQNAGGQGSSYGNYPNGRQYTIGLSIGF